MRSGTGGYWDVLETLVCEVQFDALLMTKSSDPFLEIRLDLLSDNDDDLIDSGFDCIMDGVVHDELVGEADGLQLFDSNAVSGADAGGHDKEY